MTKYKTEDVIKITGVGMDTLKYLIRTKSFVPEWPSPGKRQRNYYSEDNIKTIREYMKHKPIYKKDVLRSS